MRRHIWSHIAGCCVACGIDHVVEVSRSDNHRIWCPQENLTPQRHKISLLFCWLWKSFYPWSCCNIIKGTRSSNCSPRLWVWEWGSKFEMSRLQCMTLCYCLCVNDIKIKCLNYLFVWIISPSFKDFVFWRWCYTYNIELNSDSLKCQIWRLHSPLLSLEKLEL